MKTFYEVHAFRELNKNENYQVFGSGITERRLALIIAKDVVKNKGFAIAEVIDKKNIVIFTAKSHK